MTKDVAFDLTQVVTQPMMRPRAGAVKQPDGTYADEDVEVGFVFCVGCTGSAPILDGMGQRRGVAIPVGGFFRSAVEVRAEAAKLLGIADEEAPPRSGLVAV